MIPLGCYQSLMPPFFYGTGGNSCMCAFFFFFLFVLTHLFIMLSIKNNNGYKKSLLDAASSPALSLVTNGHHFRVPKHINVSSGTRLPAYVILIAQFSASELPPPSSSLAARLMWCDVAWLPSSHPLVWVTGEAERYLVCWTTHSCKTQTCTTHTQQKADNAPVVRFYSLDSICLMSAVTMWGMSQL